VRMNRLPVGASLPSPPERRRPNARPAPVFQFHGPLNIDHADTKKTCDYMPSALRPLAIEQVGVTDGERNFDRQSRGPVAMFSRHRRAARFGGWPEALYASAHVADRWLCDLRGRGARRRRAHALGRSAKERMKARTIRWEVKTALAPPKRPTERSRLYFLKPNSRSCVSADRGLPGAASFPAFGGRPYRINRTIIA